MIACVIGGIIAGFVLPYNERHGKFLLPERRRKP
jgi:hypothetical protein